MSIVHRFALPIGVEHEGSRLRDCELRPATGADYIAAARAAIPADWTPASADDQPPLDADTMRYAELARCLTFVDQPARRLSGDELLALYRADFEVLLAAEAVVKAKLDALSSS